MNRYYKRFYAQTMGGLLAFYFRHFPGSNADARQPNQLRADFRQFDLKLHAGYAMSVDLFHGDWFDSATHHREWLNRSAAPWMTKGSLSQRTDMDEAQKRAPYGIFVVAPFGPLTTAAADPLSDFSKIRAVTDRFRAAGVMGKPFILSQPTTESARTMPGCDQDGFGSDCGTCAARTGGSELISQIRAQGLGFAAVNRDMGHWSLATVCTQPPAEDALLRNVDFSSVRPDLPHTCHAAQTVRAMRELSHIKFLDGLGGAVPDSILLSGQAGVGQLCYRPADPGNDMSLHRHRVGGGSFSSEAWVDLLQWHNAQLVARGIPLPAFGHEAVSAEMVGDAQILFGRERGWPRSDVPAYSRTSAGEPVPLMSALFHDLAVLQNFSGFESDYATVYGTMVGAYLSRYSAALDVVTFGEQPSVPLALDDFPYLTGALVEQKFDGRPQDRTAQALMNLDYFASLARLREVAAPFLVFGKMLRPPQPERIATSTVNFRVDGAMQPRTIPHVVTGAWAASDGSVALVFANFTEGSEAASVSFSPVDYGLIPTKSYVASLATLNNPVSVLGEFSGAITRYATPEISLGPAPGAPSLALIVVRPK